MIEISKKLLLELKLFDNIENREWIYKVDKNTLIVIYNMTNYFDGNVFTINIYEFAHKCKEWALRQNIELRTSTIGRVDFYDCNYDSEFIDGFEYIGNTEVEAIIKACEWILKEIKK